MDLARHRFEPFVPDVDDNRARWRRGEPAVVIQIRPPTAGAMRRWYAATHATLAESANGAELPSTYLLDDRLMAPLWLECVGAVEGLTVDGEPVVDGAALWALRDEVGLPALFTGTLMAIQDKATLEAGLARFLGKGSPSPVSQPDNGGAALAVGSAG